MFCLDESDDEVVKLLGLTSAEELGFKPEQCSHEVDGWLEVDGPAGHLKLVNLKCLRVHPSAFFPCPLLNPGVEYTEVPKFHPAALKKRLLEDVY